jgi:hypothetical protein
MLLGLVLFGVATIMVKRGDAPMALTEERAQLFSYLFIGLAAAALAGMIFIRSRLAAATDVKRLFMLYVVGYAMAESAALFAGATWYIGGAREWFIAGLVLMVAAFQILPIKRDL